MRYLGNKAKLVEFIKDVIEKHRIEGETFADLFSGTCSVGDYFKDQYSIIANDYMYYSKIISDAKILNSKKPDFIKFKNSYNQDPFDYLNSKEYFASKNYFIYNNLSPRGNRQYFTEVNAIKIDGMRIDIEEFYKEDLLQYNEYAYVLASLLASVLKVSNTSGTYQAYFKFWESRSTNPLKIEPIDIKVVSKVDQNNIAYNENINKIVRSISGDIAYLDPPYTITQYTNSYHVLETIARYDFPELFGKTGRRKKRELSNFSNKTRAKDEFEDLLRQIDFEHVLISYSNQSIIPIQELVELARIFSSDKKVHVEESYYREYATNNISKKGGKVPLKEYIIYFKKDRIINKSPLNYSGSKDWIMNKITKELPKRVEIFIDAMGGAFNVGANITATEKVIYNEFNPFVFNMVKYLTKSKSQTIIDEIENKIIEFGLEKKGKEKYIEFRKFYNHVEKTPINLFILHIFAFQNMIRFNTKLEMNTPVGNNEFSEGIKERIKNFHIKSKECQMLNGSYEKIPLNNLPKGTVFYFDPPYFITKAEYNDGKRGLEGWDAEKETQLLNYLCFLDKNKFKFMLSNIVLHKGKTHHLLLEWIKTNNFNLIKIGETGIKYPRNEVLVTNFNEL
jgi:adenine-specific DNA-methyltransferase